LIKTESAKHGEHAKNTAIVQNTRRHTAKELQTHKITRADPHIAVQDAHACSQRTLITTETPANTVTMQNKDIAIGRITHRHVATELQMHCITRADTHRRPSSLSPPSSLASSRPLVVSIVEKKTLKKQVREQCAN